MTDLTRAPTAADGPLGRLVLCVLVSAFVHFLLIVGFPAGAGGDQPAEAIVITARLQPAEGAEPVEEAASVTEAPLPPPLPDPVPQEIAPEPAPVAKAAPPPAEPARPVEKPAAAAAGSLAVAHDEYYPLRQLDVQPSPLMPLRPACAENSVLKEELTLMVFINERGSIDDIDVTKAPSSGTCVAEMVALMKPIVFSPGIKDGRAVKSRAQIVFRPTPEQNVLNAR